MNRPFVIDNQYYRFVDDAWSQTRDDGSLLAAVRVLADEFGKARPSRNPMTPIRREDLELICFEYITG